MNQLSTDNTDEVFQSPVERSMCSHTSHESIMSDNSLYSNRSNSQNVSNNLQNNAKENIQRKLQEDQKKDNLEEEEEFKHLTYEQVQINLRFLADLKEGEKLMITGGRFMTVDQRYGQSIRRYLTSDSRLRTLKFISHIIFCTKIYCKYAVDAINNDELRQINLEKLMTIQSLLRSAMTGLGRLSSTYSEDKLNLATIETFKSDIGTFCDQDLKRAIDADKTKKAIF